MGCLKKFSWVIILIFQTTRGMYFANVQTVHNTIFNKRQEALIYFIKTNNTQMAEKLVIKGADIYLMDKFGYRPIDYAQYNPYLMVILQFRHHQPYKR